MAINLPIISSFDPKGLNQAEKQFAQFKKEFASAQGALAKGNVLVSNAFSLVKQNAAALATAGAAAIGAFVVKSVSAFQDLALASGKFADATGLSTEQASRLIEVVGDIGVEAATVEKSVSFMNKTLGNSPEVFRELGVEIAKTSSGATDVNQTFLNVIDRLNGIKDPAQRAAAGTKLLGKSWGELAELVALGSDELAAALAKVSDSKVIDEDEVRKAREFRAAVDELKDKFEDFALALGEKVVPLLSDVLDFVNAISGGDLTGGALSKLAELFDDDGLVSRFRTLKDEQEFLNQAWKDGYTAQINANSASAKLTTAMEFQAAAVQAANIEWDILKGRLNFQAETIQLQNDIEAFRTKFTEAMRNGTLNADEFALGMIALQQRVANAAIEISGLATTVQNSRLRFLVETGRLEYALALINAIRQASQNIGGPFGFLGPESIPLFPKFADGGIVNSPTFAMIGDRKLSQSSNPEAVVPLKQLGKMGNGINITINGAIDPVSTARQIRQILQNDQSRLGLVSPV